MWSNLKLIIPLINNPEILEYYRSAGYFLQGQIPYHDFYWEYPPGMLLIFGIWRFVAPDLESFRLILFLWLLASLVVFIWLFNKFTNTTIIKLHPGIDLAVTILILILALTTTKIFINPEIFVALLVLVAFAALNKQKFFLAGFLWGWATVIRIYPGLFLLLLLNYRRSLKKNLLTLVGFALPWLITFLILGGLPVMSGFFNSLTAQINRPPQIESVNASLMWLVSRSGNPLITQVQPEYMSINLLFVKSPEWWAIIGMIKWLPLILTIYFIIKSIKQTNYTEHLFYQLCLLLITGLITAHNVFSPQYLIWLWVPFGLWLITAYKDKIVTPLQSIIYLAIFLIIHLLTTLILTYYSLNKIHDLLNLKTTPMLIIMLRNLLIIGIWLVIFKKLVFTLKELRRNNN